VSPDGSRLFVTGSSYGGPAGSDFATVAYDSTTGDELWISREDGQGDAYSYALGVSPDGSTIFVTGSGAAPDNDDYATVAYDSGTGARLWAHRARARGVDSAYALAVSPDGASIFVTGQVQVRADGRGDYGTIAYEA
jgi:hypothetical protein